MPGSSSAPGSSSSPSPTPQPHASGSPVALTPPGPQAPSAGLLSAHAPVSNLGLGAGGNHRFWGRSVDPKSPSVHCPASCLDPATPLTPVAPKAHESQGTLPASPPPQLRRAHTAPPGWGALPGCVHHGSPSWSASGIGPARACCPRCSFQGPRPTRALGHRLAPLTPGRTEGHRRRVGHHPPKACAGWGAVHQMLTMHLKDIFLSAKSQRIESRVHSCVDRSQEAEAAWCRSTDLREHQAAHHAREHQAATKRKVTLAWAAARADLRTLARRDKPATEGQMPLGSTTPGAGAAKSTDTESRWRLPGLGRVWGCRIHRHRTQMVATVAGQGLGPGGADLVFNKTELQFCKTKMFWRRWFCGLHGSVNVLTALPCAPSSGKDGQLHVMCFLQQ